MTKEAFSWFRQYQIFPFAAAAVFEQAVDAFLSAEGLPFAEIVSAAKIDTGPKPAKQRSKLAEVTVRIEPK
jgi:hypothetical protein